MTVTLLAGVTESASHRATQRAATDDLRTFRFVDSRFTACLMKLGNKLSDSLPTVAAVDVEGCKESEQNPAAFTVRDKWVRIALTDGGWFDYQHLGVPPDGTHVLHTRSSGGGTGIFEDLLLIRFQWDRVRHDSEKRDRLLITSVGSFNLGDRDDGEIRCENTKVFVGRSRYREQDVIIETD